MKKIEKSHLMTLLAGASCIFLLVGGYLAYTGIVASANEQSLIEQINKANETNKGLQENLKTVKAMLGRENSSQNIDPGGHEEINEEVARSDKQNSQATKDAVLENVDLMTWVYKGDVHPLYLDEQSLNSLYFVGVNAYTVKYAYEKMLREEGYPEELNGHGLIQKIQLIDDETCMVILNNGEISVTLIYTLEYDYGIKFIEIKRDIEYDLHVFMSLEEREFLEVDNHIVTLLSRYDLETMELVDSEVILKNSTFDFSPDGLYMTIINFGSVDNRNSLRGTDVEELGPTLIVKNTMTGDILYKDTIEWISNFQVSWSLNSDRFILGHKLYHDFEAMKITDIGKDQDESFKLIASILTEDYIVNFGIDSQNEGPNMVISQVYDHELNYMKEIFIAETEDEGNEYSNIYYFPKFKYHNSVQLNYYVDESNFQYLIDIDSEQIDKVGNQLQDYHYIPELEWKMRQVPDEEGVILIFEDYDGNRIGEKHYKDPLIYSYLGVNVELKEMYFRDDFYDYEDGKFDDQFIIIYNYEDDNFVRVQLPLTHVNAGDRVDGVLNYPIDFGNGILEVYTVIPIDNTHN